MIQKSVLRFVKNWKKKFKLVCRIIKNKKPQTARAPTYKKHPPRAIMSDNPTRVRCSHLLVKHQESRRPASWRDETGAIITKKTKQAAIDELLAFKEQIDAKAISFAELASRVSDCSSARNGGDLGVFGRGQMQKAFEDAAFGLEVGEMSGVVDSDSGVHIVLRVE